MIINKLFIKWKELIIYIHWVVIKLPKFKIKYIYPYIEYPDKRENKVRQALEKLIEATNCLMTIAIIPLVDAVEVTLLLTIDPTSPSSDIQKNVVVGTFYFPKKEDIRTKLIDVQLHLEKIVDDINNYINLLSSEKPEIIELSRRALTEFKKNIDEYKHRFIISHE